MKRRITAFIDTLLIFIVSAFFSIAVAGYFVRDTTTILAAGITAAVCITALLGIFQKKRKAIENPEIRNVLTQFIYNDESYAYNFIKDALSKKYTVTDNESYLLINNTAIFVHLTQGRINSTALGQIYGKCRASAKKIIILCIDGLDKDAETVRKILPSPAINIFNGEKVYSLLKWLNSLPPIEITLQKNKTSFKEFFALSLSPDKARGYFFTAFILIISSFFMPSSIYYMVASSICITLGILSKINLIDKLKKKNV